jgi:hypothetical protein
MRSADVRDLVIHAIGGGFTPFPTHIENNPNTGDRHHSAGDHDHNDGTY